MPLTQNELKYVSYLRTSLRLQAPDLETDPAYKFTDEELLMILDFASASHNSELTTDTLPITEANLVMLLGKKEVYYRLATSTAPFYPLSAEGASLQKNVRFDHYMALIKQVTDDYNSLTGGGSGGGDTGGLVETYESTVQGKPYARRNYNLADLPSIELTLSGITPTSVNAEWTKSDRHFGAYSIYVAKERIIDEYASNPIRMSSPLAHFTDIHRTRTRLTNLTPDTEYFIVVKVQLTNGVSNYAELSFRTQPEIVVTP
jgi:Fibronectin type III domain